ncbi:MAG: transglycosylase SLT domain-containing protein [Desulfobacteraceae bacterium]|nr:transglycosylase SLT domain-containing protein [Desulfobacteraceae bacterium]
MDEDSFTRLFSVKIICLTLTFAFIVVLYAFGTFARENTEHHPSNEQVKEKKVEEVTSHSAPDRSADVVVSLALGKKSELFHPIIVKAASRYEVDPALVKAIIMAESGYNPQAVSRQGAKGLMQLMPRTARSLGVEDSFNPEHNVNGGVKYLKQLLDEFDDNLKFALAAYNAGSSKVRRHRGIPPIKATQYYVNRVFEYYQYYKNEAVKETDNV